MKKIKRRLHFCAFLGILICTFGPGQSGYAQVNANNRVPENHVPFQYGVNPGYYGNGWTDTALAGISARAGSLSFRASLPDHFVTRWGYNIRVNEFAYYTQNLGMKGLTLFVGEPDETHIDKTTYPPASGWSKIFANLYTPVWDNGENGTPVNDNNYFAVYVYNLVKSYGNRVQYWEIVNEPDYTGFWDNGNRSRSNNWYDNAPSPADLPNLKAPVYYYIRMLRIAYDVIKKYQPDSYVAPGGLGYPAFLDALLRYTDNPDQGKISGAYPLKGGAYFDVLSFHLYPATNLSIWDNCAGGRVWRRHSDAAVDKIFELRDEFRDVLRDHGYNGTTYPAKPFIITELNIPRKMVGDHYGGEEAQRNFIIKAAVACQKNDIRQFYIFKTGEDMDLGSANIYNAMGLYENLKRDKPGSEKMTQEGKALKTTSQLLYGWSYDAGRTGQLMLPANVGGAAFKKGEQYRYVLWAKTATDKSEAASATYSFPPSLGIDSVVRYEWDYSVRPAATSTGRAQNLSLSGTPSFFELGAKVQGPLAVNILSFGARAGSCEAMINWKVSFDEPGATIILEESENDRDYRTIYSTALTKNTQTGSYKQPIHGNGLRVYRLTILAANGQKTYSAVRKVTMPCGEPDAGSLQVYPNPVTDAVYLRGLEPGQNIQLFDNSGRKIRSVTNSSDSERIDMSQLPSGSYFLRLSDRSGDATETIKVLKK